MRGKGHNISTMVNYSRFQPMLVDLKYYITTKALKDARYKLTSVY